MSDVDLAYHGDAELAPGLVDCAVNVRPGAPPQWLCDRLRAALDDVAAYPSDAAARAAIAERHGRPVDEVLVTAGAAEAFVLLARAMRPRHAVAVHPSFTAPEAALLQAGAHVERVVLPPPFILDPVRVPSETDFVVLGNPTNPTGVLHPWEVVHALAKPGRVLVVDEAFMDFAPPEEESLAGAPDVVVVRSLTKMWGLAGLRVGYLLGPRRLLARVSAVRPPWAVSSLACAAVEACLTPSAIAEGEVAARDIAEEAVTFRAELARIPGLQVWPTAANFLLMQAPGRADLHGALRAVGFAVRRCDTFPGLGPDYIRVAVRDPATNEAVVSALRATIG